MGLDARGYISIVEIIIYIPILLIGVVLSLRHGFKRKAGWIMLVILSIIRLIGGVTRILSENNPTNTTERVIYSIMESAGLSPLLVASLGFLGTVTQYSHMEQNAMVTRALRILGLVGTVGLILTIVGGTDASDATSLSDINDANNLRHIGTILFVVVFVGVVAMTGFCWLNRGSVAVYRYRLLLGIAATLPFLLVRTVYAVLSSYAPFTFTVVDGNLVFTAPSSSGLGPFSSNSSQWGYYLVMSVAMEYAAVVIYTVVGIITPLSKDAPDYDKAPLGSHEGSLEAYQMSGYNPQYYTSQPQQYAAQQQTGYYSAR